MICMVELGQLEARHQDFDSRHVRVVAVSMDGLEDSRWMQDKFPHLVIVSDKEENLAKAAGTLATGQRSHDGGDTNAPTTIYIDRGGDVRAVKRPDRFLERFSPDDVLAAAKESFPNG
jgi:peroxiredoxin